MLKIGLTGNIASGKSLLESMLKEMDIPVIDADKICHNLLDFDKKTIQKVKELLKGKDILKDDGQTLDRYKIGQLIFNDLSLKLALEDILHPQVVQVFEKFFKENQKYPFAVASVPLLFEAQFDYLFDRIILVTVNREIQLERLLKRNGFDEEHALARINSQMPQEKKIDKSHYIIENSGSIENTKNQLEKVIQALSAQD